MVPAEAREGDLVVIFAHCYEYVLVRQRPLGSEGATATTDGLITRAFEDGNSDSCPAGPIRVMASYEDDEDMWVLGWERAKRSFPIVHCSLVGQCNFGEGAPWKQRGPGSDFSVFALH